MFFLIYLCQVRKYPIVSQIFADNKANIYNDAKIVLHKDRVLRHIVLPYEHLRSSRNYSWYQHIL